ncbi:DUF853 family protein [Acidobacteria bacterium AB60]|nr:DUF853 family protein [Acidobacteria bacterium AB60]
MSKGLHIADNFSFPLDLVTSTQAILARKRSGKSYTASVEAEEMLENGQQIAVIDPTSAWYGLRSSADGQGPGYPVVVFGGDHADAPLDFRSGKQMARALVDLRFSAIFDVGSWETDEQIQFSFAFASELLRINRAAMHLFIDEADTFAPQLLESREQKKCLGAMSRLVKQGGIKGIGVTMITQRSADINKKLLSQIDILTVLRMSAPDDLVPPIKWIAANVGPDYAKEVEKALPRLGVGKAYVCSNLTGHGQYIEVRQRRTFNSGATPKPGEQRAEPKVLAKIDIQKLGREIAAAVEEQKQNDPDELKRKVADLEKRLAFGEGHISKERERMLVEQIQKMETDLTEAQGKLGEQESLISLFRERFNALSQHAPALSAVLRILDDRIDIPAAVAPTVELHTPVRTVMRELKLRPESEWPKPAVTSGQFSSPQVDVVGLDGPSRRVLAALADLEAMRIAPAPREQVAVFANYSHLNSKGLVNALGFLRTNGLIDYPEPGKIALTEEGRKVAPPISKPKTEREFHERLMGMMGGPERKLLEVLISLRSKSIDRAELAAKAGYGHLNSKGFVNAMGRLRTLGLLDYPTTGKVRATDLLFLEAR